MKVNIGPYPEDNSDRVVEVKVHDYDAWGVDHTLSLIIVPLLQKLRSQLLGAPCLEPEEVPEDLQSYVEDEDWTKDDKHHKMNIFRTWENILDEMIWAFSQIQEDEDIIEHQERVDRGCELFGKFYRNLWY